MNNKINLLIITSMWPENKKDISGIFVVDYAKAVKMYCNVSILIVRLVGNKKGLTVNELNGIKIYKYCISEKYPYGVKKALMYLKWFYIGWRIGSRIHGINLVHAHGSTLCGNLGYLVSRSLKIPFIVTEHTGPFKKLLEKTISRMLTRNALRKASVVLTVSADLEKQMGNSNIRPKRIIITHNPVDIELFKINNSSNAMNLKNIIYVGRLEEYKGGLRVVRAFQRLVNEFPDWHLTIVGDGPELDPITNITTHSEKLKASIFLKGQLPKEIVAEEMRKASFFVYPSRHETFGLVVAEAMASGLPVVVGQGTAMDEFVNDSCGIFVDPDDIIDISQAMRCMILQIDKYKAELIRRQIVNRFGFQTFGNKLVGIYRSVI